MPLDVPRLDDLSHDRLVTEGRSLIPELSPAWTDHNPSDSGITLLELLAWFTETAGYQLDQVPEDLKARFLRLVGGCGETGGPIERAVTAEDFGTLGLRLARELATPVTGADPQAQTVLARGVPAGATGVGTIEVRRPVFRLGDEITIGAGDTAAVGEVIAVDGNTLTVPQFSAPDGGFPEAAARAGLELFRDPDCSVGGHPPSAVLIVVVPDRPYDPAPAPTRELTDALYREMTRHRLLTTRVHVIGPTYVPVSVHVTVAAATGRGLYGADVEEALRRFLGPLRGGADGSGWRFGRPLYASEVYQLIEGLDGVDHVEELALLTEPPGIETAEGIRLPGGGLVAAREVVATVIGG
ncbi:hypothetical protein ACYSUO_10115 [Streptomyces sp. UC4497]